MKIRCAKKLENKLSWSSLIMKPCHSLVDEESKKSLCRDRKLRIPDMDEIRISADLQETERSAIKFKIFVSKVVSSTLQDRENVPPNSYTIFHLSAIMYLVKAHLVPMYVINVCEVTIAVNKIAPER